MHDHDKKRPFRQSLWALVAIFALACFSSSARATSVLPPDFATLVSHAEVIFRGQVTALRSEWIGSGSERTIVTYVTFHVQESLKGTPPATYTLRLLGGTVGGQTLEVSGAPTFAVGDRTLLFVENNGKQFVPLVGIMHGYFRLQTDPKTGVETVIKHDGTPLKSVAEIDRAHDHAVAPDAPIAASPASPSGPLKTSEFEDQIRQKLASPGK